MCREHRTGERFGSDTITSLGGGTAEPDEHLEAERKRMYDMIFINIIYILCTFVNIILCMFMINDCLCMHLCIGMLI